MNWRPSAEPEMLRRRARLFAAVRAFFAARDVLEVDTPHLGGAGVTDPRINSLATEHGGRLWYLQTSPEYFMKRLLAADAGDIFQLAHVFRGDDAGRYHNPEFALLEWYRCGWSTQQLMEEVVELLREVSEGRFDDWTVRHATYRQLFMESLRLDPLTAGTEELQASARSLPAVAPTTDMSRDDWLDWLFASGIQPEFPAAGFTCVSHYPASQASLAALSDDGATALRFELFAGRVELANGYHELRDADRLRARFEQDLSQRESEQLPRVPIDEDLLAALPTLPRCSGVALGLDRLLMCLTGADRMEQVMPFAWTSS